MRMIFAEEDAPVLERPAPAVRWGKLIPLPEPGRRTRPREAVAAPFAPSADALSHYLRDVSRIPLPGPDEQLRRCARLDRARQAFRSSVVGSPLALAEAVRVLRELQRDRIAFSRVFQAGRGAPTSADVLPRLPWILDALRTLQAEARAAAPACRARWSAALLSLDFHPDVFRAMVARQEAFSRTLDGILRESAARSSSRSRLRRIARSLRAESGGTGGALRRRLREIRARAAEFERARADLAASHLRLVVSIARRHSRSRGSLLDLIQEGNLGLLKAVERFDPSLGFSFSTYAKWWIWQAVSQTARLDRSPAVPLDEASVGRLASGPGFVRDAAAVRAALERALGTLSVRERRVIRLRYGLDLAPPVSGAETGRALGVSRERVRQLETAALARLRRIARPLGLDDLLG